MTSRLRRVCAFAGLLVGCGVDQIEHLEDPSPTNATATTQPFPDTASTDGGVFGDTNFPEPALTRCGEIDGVEPIDGMRSAWAVVALPGSTYGHAPIEAGSIRLRFGEQPLFDCGQPFEAASCPDGGGSPSTGFGGECGWGFALTLAADEVHAGTHRLEALAEPEFELVLGDGPGEAEPVTGELKIERVTPDCIVGALFDVETNEFTAPSLDGMFAAERCDRTCVPGPADDCE